MRPNVGPFTQPGWRKRIAANVLPPAFVSLSGERTASIYHIPVDAPRFAGEITGVNLSVVSCGRDNTNPLSVEGSVYINGVSALTTGPKLAFVSGEAPGHKTSFGTAYNGVTQAVIDKDNASFDAGDVISVSFLITRTASPTNEIANPCMVLELEPTM